MIIRQKQIEVFRRELIRGHLKNHLPTACAEFVHHLPSAEFDRRLDHALRVAHAYGIDEPPTLVASFVTLLFHTGPLLHEHPLMRAILDDRDDSAKVRIERLLAEPSAWTWVAVSDPSDAAWQRALCNENPWPST